MKRLTYLLIFVASFGYSQSNLVFNQVLNFRLNNATTVTVPDGKVWKVEHASGPNSSSLIASNQETSYGLPLNSSSYHLLSSQNNNATWFSEGTILSSGTSCILSILEFDVVPVSTSSTGSGGLSSEGLEFNQVINYSNNFIVDGYGEIIDTIDVPQGKVWKITRATLIRSNPPGNFDEYRPTDVSNAAIYLGGILIFYRPPTTGYSTSSYDNYPIWINSGTKEISVGDNDNATHRYLVSFTAIEYNTP